MPIAGRILLLSTLVFGVGCGGDGLERAPITGLLTLNGAPLANASVQFTPASGTPGEGAIGTTDAAGKFEVISSRRDDAGIPPGKYSVRVSLFMNPDGTPVPADAPQADYPFSQEAVPPPYSSIDSPLTATIAPEGGEIKVEIPAKLLQIRQAK